MARWSMLVISAGRTWSVELPASRPLLIGRGRQASIDLKDAGVAERHATLAIRDQALQLEVLRGAGEVVLNDVAIAGTAQVHHGDELRLGSARLVAQYSPPVPALRPRVAGFDELSAILRSELARAGRARPVGVVAIGYASLNVTARQALIRRVIDEVAKAGVVGAVWGEFATDLLVGVVPEVSEARLSELFEQVPLFAGPRATVAVARSPRDGLEADVLVGALWSQLLGPEPGAPPEPIVADPVMVRLFGLMDSLIDSSATVCLTGAPGSGRATLLRHLASQAGKQLLERRGRLGADPGEDAWLLVHELEVEQQERVSQFAARVLATSRVAPEGFDVVFGVPPLHARPTEIPLMAEAFLGHARVVLGRPRLHLAADALPSLLSWPWPGNVLELKNTMFRAARSAVRDEVSRDSLPSALSAVGPVENLRGAMESAERELLLEALSRTRWNVTAAAGRLGMARRTVVYRMRKLGLKRPAR